MSKRIWLFLLLCLGLVLNPTLAVSAERPKVVVLILDHLSLQDWQSENLPNLQKLMAQGALGLMNTPVAQGYPRSANSTMLTIGAGTRLGTDLTTELALDSNETWLNERAFDLYRQRMGYHPTGQISVLSVPQLLNLAAKLPYLNQPGALGETIHRQQLRTALIGDRDRDLPFRPAALFAMDAKGQIDFGAVGSRITTIDPERPFSKKIDVAKTKKVLKQVWNVADLIIIDWGDLGRLEAARNMMLPEWWQAQRKQVLQEADSFLGQLYQLCAEEKAYLLIISPTPSAKALEEDRTAAPLLLVGPGIKQGWLFSPTTKREGLVANIDVAPAILQLLHLDKPEVMLGQAFKATGNGKKPEDLIRQEERMVAVFQARPPLARGYAFWELVVLLLALVSVFLHRPRPKTMGQILLAFAAVPAVFLLLPLLPVQSLPVLLGVTILATFVLTVVLLPLRKVHILLPFAMLFLFTVSVIVIDTVMGNPLMKQSVLGYDFLVGARYYGIGNEYEGVILGASIVGVAILAEIWSKQQRLLGWVIAVVFAGITYLLAAPGLGSDVGGAIAAVGGFIWTWLLLQGKQIRWRQIFGIGLATILLLVLFFYWDWQRPPELQTHMGRTMALVVDQGWKALFDIFQRKLAMNYKLIVGVTVWARVFLGALLVLTILFYRPVGVMKRIRQTYPVLFRGLSGAMVAVLLVLIVNDSGIVAAATAMIYLSSPLLYLVLNELNGRRGL
ncbi:hypothetical protein SAMN02745885_01419 [Carboxydocella sporoproducens DSM 16521]|uniref:Type I phosphodiesterase / nucleotide pyrophosphatase n=2 Tax=Carboxydocella TaxID=178898 RepID=A0A1T4PV53_9FIRM|nr:MULTISPECIES: hypothetical protein [Carboxydocella]AVX20451.1 hypothetical protein CFE_1262 [Carboxydocella thermautotrophica]AVX30872.1 hypothetical protein CTH_1282 [Carboxydocella thermautotrophica]SJZ95432.1 hypothetical protein SAMN02745885_01419 [Carboxydocella sporoproducens DSM 16521]